MTTLQMSQPGTPLAHALARNWWLILLRGLVAVLFGVLTFIWPIVSLLTLVTLYGAFALVDGVLALWAAISGGTPAPRWWLVVVGFFGIAAGLIALAAPGLTALVLLWCIAVWAIAIGVMQIIGAIRLRKEIDNEWLLAAAGLVSILFGLFLLFAPGAGVLGLLFMVGAFAIVDGVMLIGLAFRLKSHK